MELLSTLYGYIAHLFGLLLHFDKYLGAVIQDYGAWTYLILFLIVFCETGLVVLPMLPGDSLLFVVGTFAAVGYLDVYLALGLITAAAILGDTVNYSIGHYIGPKVFHYESSRFFKKEHLMKTHAFYEKYGGKTIVIARFIPIIRTFAPFVAGVGAMTYSKFILYNVGGALLWVLSIGLAGYFFGNIPIIRNNFSLMVIAIIIVSIMPPIIEYVRHLRRRRAARPGAAL
ncbi:MAG: DedA family protein [Elusimicrobiales bacterium]